MIGMILILSSAVAQAPPAAEAPTGVVEPTDLKARAEAVVTIHRNVRQREASNAAIANAFRLIQDSELKPSALSTYDTRTLEVLFESVAIASEHLHEPNLLQAMDDIFQEALRRGFVGTMVDRMYVGYVHRRAWQKARELNDRFPSRPRELPTIVEPDAAPDGVPAVYEVSEDGDTLTYTTVDLSGPIIVSVVSPGCHFSRDLVQRIEADPKLATLFSQHAINIDPAPYRIDTARLARANSEGQFSYVLLYRESDWTGFDFSSMPQFYFVKDGKIVHEVRSVEPDQLETKLEEGLASVGLQMHDAKRDTRSRK